MIQKWYGNEAKTNRKGSKMFLCIKLKRKTKDCLHWLVREEIKIENLNKLNKQATLTTLVFCFIYSCCQLKLFIFEWTLKVQMIKRQKLSQESL